jgi:hypothetical protein
VLNNQKLDVSIKEILLKNMKIERKSIAGPELFMSPTQLIN